MLFVKRAVISIATVGVLFPQLAYAAKPVQLVAGDVALQRGGTLYGQVVNASHEVQAETPVWIIQKGQRVAVSETDKQGRFAISGLSGGVYQVHTASGSSTYRVWAEKTAPPGTLHQARLVQYQSAASNSVGGGCCPGIDGKLGYFMSHPLLLGGIVAAAIAIPVALSNNGS